MRSMVELREVYTRLDMNCVRNKLTRSLLGHVARATFVVKLSGPDHTILVLRAQANSTSGKRAPNATGSVAGKHGGW